MNTQKLSQYSVIFIATSLVIFLLHLFQNFMRPLAIALIISFLFTPVYRYSKKKKAKYYAKTAVSIVIVMILLITVVAVLFQGMTNIINGEETNNYIEEHINSGTITVFGTDFSISKILNLAQFGELLKAVMKFIVDSARIFVSEILLIFLFLIFLLPTLNIWVKKMTSKMESKDKNKFLKTIVDMETGIREYLKVKTVVSLATGLLSLIVLALFGAKFALFLAAIIFALNYIPNIGSIIAVVIVLIIQSFNMGFSIGFVVMGILLISIQIIIGNFVEPIFAGKTLKLSPLIVILSLFFWGAIWGIGGMLFSVPLTLSIKIFLNHHKSTKGLANMLS